MKYLLLTLSVLSLSVFAKPQIDYVISSERVFNSDKKSFEALDIAICGKTICDIGQRFKYRSLDVNYIDYGSKVISPGFIDPHTHSLSELKNEKTSANLNYLTQGVTTVINGNDGKSPLSIAKTTKQLLSHGIGTNVAFFIGHNTVRNAVMGKEDRQPSTREMNKMKALVERNMQAGALGLSTGLYYLPGTFATTEEVVTLAKVAANYQGIYETHLRDE
ncbi:MAG: amidohydrolase family protein, partial [Pseudoalteromonas spongiae]